jgi:DNA-binding NarL/FixJ family response regulator
MRGAIISTPTIAHLEREVKVLVRVLRGIAAGHKLLLHAPLKSEQGAQEQRFLPRCDRRNCAAALILRERQITRLASEGLTNNESGREPKTSHGAIKVDLHNIYQKLGISNELHLPLWLCGQERTRAEEPFVAT